MLTAALLSLSLLPNVWGQFTGDPVIQYDLIHNETTLYGTWSTGSGGVQTGSGFANPAEMTFTYPKTTGWSVSFSQNNEYEWAQYTFSPNATDPTCIIGYVMWQHGTYTEEVNGTLSMKSFDDGYQQVQNACGAETNIVEPANDKLTFPWWTIQFDDESSRYMLKLQKYDLTWYPPFKQVSATPNMLPARKMRTDTLGSDVSIAPVKRDVLEKRNGAEGISAGSWLVSSFLASLLVTFFA